MTKQQEIDQLRALATNCERDMQKAIHERDEKENLLKTIGLLIAGEVVIKKIY